MATYAEFDSTYFTLTALAANHPACAYLVVDNAPERCPRTEAIARAVGGRYVHRPDLTGTSKPRDAVFHYAQTPWVMCVDSHVVFETVDVGRGPRVSAVELLLEWIGKNPTSRDMIQGPLVADDGLQAFSHWTRPAKPGLWGEWDAAYRDAMGNMFALRFEAGHAVQCDVMTGAEVGRVAQPPNWNPAQNGWERLPAAGASFEIPMLGLGCWAMRKDAWPGFNPLFSGFGGEEGYIHEAVRRRGGKTILLPALRWRHKFRDVGGFDRNPVPYPLKLRDHVRNLLIGHRELGIEATAQIYDHFGKKLPPADWAELAEEVRAAQPFGGPRPVPEPQTLLAVWYTDNSAPPDLMAKSLNTVRDAVAGTRGHKVKVVTVGWEALPGNPFPFVRFDGKRQRSHAALVAQIQAGMATQAGAMDTPAAVVCLEHDVLYPANYFERIGDALAANPTAPVVSNHDYIGLNATGWLGVKERHEPMHQLAVRWAPMTENLQRAAEEAARTGSAIVEPDHGADRSKWARLRAGWSLMPSVHVNHTGVNGGARFTSHGEVVYHQNSGGSVVHPYWGEAKAWWPGPMAVAPGCTACEGDKYSSLELWYAAARANASDFHEHVQTLKELADGCDVVAELSTWNKPAVVALAASAAKRVVSYAPRPKADWKRLAAFCGDRFSGVSGIPATVEPCDLLFLDTEHTMATVYAQLANNAAVVRRYFVVHTTSVYGETGDDGSPGVLGGVRKFLSEHPEWTSVRHDPNNYGLIVLSRDDRDKHRPPGIVRKGLNLVKASAAHAANGFAAVPDEVFAARTELCVLCPDRYHDLCGACGCPIAAKASWASEECGRVKLADPKKPLLWGRYDGPNRPGVEVLPLAEAVEDDGAGK